MSVSSSYSVSSSWAPIVSTSDAYTLSNFISKVYTFRSSGFGGNPTIENGEIGYTGNNDNNTVYVSGGSSSSSLNLVKNININIVTVFESKDVYFYPHTNGSGQFWAGYKETGHVGIFSGIAVPLSGIYFKTGYSGFSSPTTYYPLTWSAVVCDGGVETEVSTEQTSSYATNLLRWTYINNTASFYINGINVANINKVITSSCSNLIDVTGTFTNDQNSTIGWSQIRFNYLT